MTTKKTITKAKEAKALDTPRADLAELIAAVLAHPDTPEAIQDAITDAICSLWNSTEIYEDARAVRALLDYHVTCKSARKR